MSHDLFHLVYASCATIGFDSKENEAIRRTATQRNAERGITGFLHRHADAFVQYVEGPRPAIAALLDELRRDPRHEDIHILADGPITARVFPGWDMEFSQSSDNAVEQKDLGSSQCQMRYAMIGAALDHIRSTSAPIAERPAYWCPAARRDRLHRKGYIHAL